ncbi:LCP family protein [Clostridium sp. NSJ-49]|uniref:LCP family protein n=1 Tax=Clostridium TaxID=1485 RepID=UPI00164C2D68|nr:LCP family protein [Clostridium sp. NSJ-49]MBC5625014.1 LCP family protein [Clostridium sp. NSJ-49]
MSRVERNNKKKKKKSLFLKISITIVSIIALLIAIGIGTFYSIFNKMDNIDLNKENLGVTSKEELEVYDNYKKIKNIALFGIDSADGVGRSDSMMIATVDPVHDKLKITSLMRDSYVNIDGYGYDKLNHAYAFGGPELSIKTINQTFGLNIEDFVAVDFASLPKVIDILGGIELDITDEELQYINGYIDDINSKDGTYSPHISYAGPQHVDGVQALAYSRIRYTSGGDYERTRRHRTVLEQLFNKALTVSPTQYPTIINQLLPYVKTNLGATDILSLATKVATMGGGTLEQDRFPRDGYCWGENIDGIYYLGFDETATKQQMMDYIFDDK